MYIYICIHIYRYRYRYIHIHIDVNIYISICISIYIYIYRYIYLYTYIHVCKAFLRIDLYVCSRVCARACVRARAAKELHEVVTTSRLIYIIYISTFIHIFHKIYLYSHNAHNLYES